MDIAALSMAMSSSKVQDVASLAVMKLAMNTGKENAVQMTEMLQSAGIDPNRGQHLDSRA